MPEPIKVRLNWRAYWEKFKEAHGIPVDCRGRLLFPDGWTYSATDLSGPEWPPPEVKADIEALQKEYWTIRKALVVKERDELKALISSLEALQAGKDVPLQQSIMTEEDGKRKLTAVDVDADSLRSGRLVWLEKDVEECDYQLRMVGRELSGLEYAKGQ